MGKGMAIIVYSSKEDSEEQKLLESIRFVATDICRSVNELRRRLNTFCGERRIVILSVNDHEEIECIAELMEWYSDLLLIVIFDHDCPEANRAAFALRPRYIAYKGGDFKDVAAVLDRMIHHYVQSAGKES